MSDVCLFSCQIKCHQTPSIRDALPTVTISRAAEPGLLGRVEDVRHSVLPQLFIRKYITCIPPL